MAAIAATRPTSASFSLRLHGSRRSLSDTFAAVSQPSSVATSPQLRVSIGDAEFKKAGRYFLTLATSDVERRTSVAASSKTPNFSDSDYVFRFRSTLTTPPPWHSSSCRSASLSSRFRVARRPSA